MVKTVNASTLKTWLKEKDVLLIDVREPWEYDQAAIDEAILLPLGQVTLDALPKKTGKIVIQCRSGARSFNACELLQRQDPSLDLYNLEGGILGWLAEGFPIIKST